MAGFLGNFRNVVIVGLLLAGVFILGFALHAPGFDPLIFAVAVLRWAHVLCAILWVGLLYYFNFVQMRVMPDIPAEMKPAISKYIAPEALFWFRYAALLTVVFGLFLAWHRGYVYFTETLSLGLIGGVSPADIGFTFMGIGMWLGIVMMINVWHFIWPAQKIALGIRDGFTPEQKATAAKKAMMFSRINLMLSFPMLVAMTMYQTIFS